MDEIGKWDVGALPDSLDPNNHQSLRRHALWGHLLGGGAGVEWYFGAKYPANDLSSEDWRLRESLWQQTAVALNFFDKHLPYWQMKPCNELLRKANAYCLGKAEGIFALYLIDGGAAAIDSSSAGKAFEISYHNPIDGKMMEAVTTIADKDGILQLSAPSKSEDWVILIKSVNKRLE